MTKKIILLYFLIAFCVSCISEKSSQELLVNESEECFLKHPSQMYLANDSILLVLDRMQLYELNTYNGNLTLYNTENLKLMYESKYGIIKKKIIYNI